MSFSLPDRQAWEAAGREYFGTYRNHLVEMVSKPWISLQLRNRKWRGEMDRQGIMTPEGIAAFENGGEVSGSLAVKVHINDDKVKLDLRLVDTTGQTLAEWEGVEVIDDTQITWCFSDAGNLKLVMDPILEA